MATRALAPSRKQTSQDESIKDRGTAVRLEERYGKIPLCFVENRGQEDRRVRYVVQGKATTVYSIDEGMTCLLMQGRDL